MPPTARKLAAGPCTKAAAVAAGVVLVLAGCGGDDGGGDGGGGAASSSGGDAALGTVTTAPDGVQEVTIETPDDYVFVPDAFTVAPGPVRLTVRNTAEQMVHNFRFTPDTGPAAIDAGIDLLQPGESDTIEFEVQAPGDYPFDCSFHLQVGQVGTMTVAPAG
ncbi:MULTISPECIES: plastocyanin/azurin family copper-binding protein [unclassified Blastococcus]